MGPLRSVVLAGGGTGGHIYPLLAFADCLRRHDPGVRITCVGTPRGLENELIPPHGYDLRHIPAYQLPRSVNLNLMRTPDRMWKSARAAGKVIDEVQADVVVGFGGYVSVPAYLAAWRRELPIVIHEVNVPPGVANRLGHEVHQARRGRLPAPAGAGRVAARRPGGGRAAAAGHRRARPGGAAGRRPGPLRAPARPARRCSSPAAPRAPARSTWRSPGRPRSWPAPGCRCCT